MISSIIAFGFPFFGSTSAILSRLPALPRIHAKSSSNQAKSTPSRHGSAKPRPRPRQSTGDAAAPRPAAGGGPDAGADAAPVLQPLVFQWRSCFSCCSCHWFVVASCAPWWPLPG
uniref:Uncharacterized protein n=1 Tax=Arundo donax TaxID=35708 RepID=A0A0A9DTV0_ARUDO